MYFEPKFKHISPLCITFQGTVTDSNMGKRTAFACSITNTSVTQMSYIYTAAWQQITENTVTLLALIPELLLKADFKCKENWQ